MSGTTEFVKYCNNTGYWDTDHVDDTLLRFSEWTYKVTSGYLMITDLQGVKSGSRVYLTDLVVLCTDVDRFGYTNLGEPFMKKSLDAIRAIREEKGWF
jgi:hypothetical protein